MRPNGNSDTSLMFWNEDSVHSLVSFEYTYMINEASSSSFLECPGFLSRVGSAQVPRIYLLLAESSQMQLQTAGLSPLPCFEPSPAFQRRSRLPVWLFSLLEHCAPLSEAVLVSCVPAPPSLSFVALPYLKLKVGVSHLRRQIRTAWKLLAGHIG